MSEFDPASGLFQLQLRSAEVFAAQGRLAEMRGVLKKALPAVSRPATLFERIERFKLLIALTRYPEAIGEAERILDAESSHRTIEILKFPWNSVVFARPESRSALEIDRRVLRGLIERGRAAPWAHYYLSQLTDKADPEHAACLRAVARATPRRYGWMWREVAVLRLEQYEYAGAIEAFQISARSTTPGLWRSHAFCAETYVFLGRPKKALLEFLHAVDAAPEGEKGEALAWMGELCLWLGRYNDALTLFDRAIPLGGLYAYCWRGAAKLKLGRTREALEDLDLGLKFLPRDREAYMWRGEARRISGDYAGALEDLSEEPHRGVSASRWLWHDFNRALVHAAMKNETAMIADYDAIPAWVTGHLRRKLGLDPRRVPTLAERARVLAAGLKLSRGYRRPENHGQAAWMGAAGRRPPAAFRSSAGQSRP
ncbi:MAG: tetratricopeptide repeat protein [Elusimicrobiota bacterium]